MMDRAPQPIQNKRLISFPLALSSSRQDFYTVPTNFVARLVNIVAVNTHASTARALTLEFYDSGTTTYFNIAAGESLAAKTRLLIEGAEAPLIAMESGDKISGSQDTGTDVHCIVTIEEIGARNSG